RAPAGRRVGGAGAPAGRDRRAQSRALALRRAQRGGAARVAAGGARAAQELHRGLRPVIRGEAPGKVILLGEHAVVYGHPALAASISRRVTVEVNSGDTILNWRIEYGVPRILVPDEVLEAAKAIAREAGFAKPFHARVESEIPLGGGLGSSAALGIALARAFGASQNAAKLAMRLE